MAKKKSFAIIGLSNFGQAIIAMLISKKQHIVVFDSDPKKVNNIVASYEQVDGVLLDATVKASLLEQGLEQYDNVIVTMATNIEASILTIIGLQDIGVNSIIVKSKDDRHTRILKALGITNIVEPDTIAGNIVAAKAMFDVDIEMQTVDENYASVIIKVSEPKINDSTLNELFLLNNKDYNIVHIKRKGKVILPGDIDQIKLGDEMLFISKISAINDLRMKLESTINDNNNNNNNNNFSNINNNN